MIRSALNAHGDLYPAFPLGGPSRTVSVDANWTDLLGESTSDLLMLSVPSGTRRVVVHSSTDDLEGVASTEEQAAASWPLAPGVWTFCVDRAADGPRFYLTIDPRDTNTDVVATADVVVLTAGEG